MVKYVAEHGYQYFIKVTVFYQILGVILIAGMQSEGKGGATRVQKQRLWFDMVSLYQQKSEVADGPTKRPGRLLSPTRHHCGKM